MNEQQDISQLYLQSLQGVIRKLVQEELAKVVMPETSPIQEDAFLDTKKASEFLSISIHTLRTKAQEKKIPHYKKGNRILFLKSDLIKWVKSGRVKTYQEIQQEVETGLIQKLKI